MVRASYFGVSILLAFSLAGCGGGSDNSGSSEGAAGVSISARPSTVDIGDQVEVKINIEDVQKDGIILKVRYPAELTFTPGSSVLFLSGEDQEEDDGEDRAPDQIVTEDDDVYLIYRITEKENGDDNSSTLVFNLRANETKKEAKIAVDPDIDSTTAFDPANPEFSTEAEAIVIIDE